jgi:hypothetical protein
MENTGNTVREVRHRMLCRCLRYCGTSTQTSRTDNLIKDIQKKGTGSPREMSEKVLFQTLADND